MPKWTLQRRLLLASLLPVFTVLLAISAFLVVNRFHELDDLQDQRSRLLLERYRLPLEINPQTTLQHLQDLTSLALEDDDVRSLTLVDSHGNTLAHSGPLHRPLSDRSDIPLGSSLLRLPTRDSVLYVQRFSRALQGSQLGDGRVWVILEISRSNLIISRYELLLAALLANTLLLLGLAAVVRLLVSRWLAPIDGMRDALGQIDSGHLSLRLDTPAQGDLLELQEAINTLLARLAEDTEELRSSMSQANQDLRDTLEVMEVQNIELTLARKEAVEGNRVKSEFLANISHEIRTPLNGIMGFTKLLLKTQMTPRQTDYVRTIQKSSDSLLAIINDVLDLSKIEAGKLVLDNSPLDVEEVVFEVMNMLAPLAEEKRLEQVAFVYDDVPRHLMGDPLRLKQILTNLVNNAIKFTPSGDVTVRVMLEEQQDQQVILRFSVTDTGIGLSDQARNDLFRAFSQGDPSTTRKFGGTGLGLVISKHLAEQMGGNISCESSQGQGSTFSFTIRAEIDPHTPPGPSASSMKGRRVLVADPHPASRQMLTGVLASVGAEIESVDAVAALRQTLIGSQAPFDALIIPMNLFTETGPQRFTVSELQALYSGALIMLTRSSDSAQEQAQYQNQQVAVLGKPVIPRELQAQLQRLWSHVQESEPAGTGVVEQKIRVLAVDDNAANLRLVAALLDDLNVDCVTAASGPEAIRLAQRQHFDLIFMDIQMPGMNGLEATQKIREKETGSRRVPIIALTAHAMSNEKVALLRSGMDDYVTKPIQESQLGHILAKWTAFNRRGPYAPARQLAPAALLEPAPESGDKESPVSWEESLRLAAGKEDLARDMLDMLLKSLEAEKHKMVAAFMANDMNALLSHVHYLHGATRYCGVPALRQAANNAESDIKIQLSLHKNRVDAGVASDANNTSHCKPSLDMLFACMEELIVWRESHKSAEDTKSGADVHP